MSENNDNNEVEENADVPAETNNSSSTNKSSNVSKGIQKKVQERLSKSLKKNAVKQSLIKFLLPILINVLVFLMILIIIIGIIMFIITLPGMVMEQLKQLAKDVGNAVASWFGADSTKQVDDVRIYDTLTYLEQMGYDLKGYGFLTDYVGEDDDGVERDEEDDSIIEAKSDFIANYLISDNYVYTIKNFNIDTGNWFTALCAHLASLFTGGQTNQYWTRGMIDIWKDNGIIGKKGSYYSVYDMGSIEIDPENKTLEIKRGWFNNSMKYNLDGWTGRYGMPIDFLLSVHLATMMPDLAYDMATGFETEIQLLLHAVGGGEKDDNTAVGYYKIGDNYISYDDFEKLADDGILGNWGNGHIGKAEAMAIMKEFGIKSPDNCTGTADVGEDEVFDQPEMPVQLGYTAEDGSNIDSTDSNYLSDPHGEDGQQNLIDTYKVMIDKFKEYGFTAEDASTNQLPESISNINQLKDLLEVVEKEDVDETYIQYVEDPMQLSKTISWNSNNSEFDTYTATIKIDYVNYRTNPSGQASLELEQWQVTNNFKFTYKITGEWSEERIQEWLDDQGIETTEEAKCSNLADQQTECCSACRKYIQSIYDEICKADVSDLEIYQPYISKVTDHWYRDVYFAVDEDGSTNIVANDYDYEAIMKERWTLYETYDESDGEPDKIGEFKLYKVNEDGSMGDLYEGTQEDAEKEGIAVSKKAEIVDLQNDYQDLNWNLKNGVMSAYLENTNTDTPEDYQAVYPDITEEDDDYEIKKDIYVKIITTGSIEQTGEGQRGETNDKIKKMFLQNEYLRYDGSQDTAEIITKLRKQINGEDNENYYGPVEGINNNDEEVDYTDVSVEIDGEEHKISEYSGKVNLNQDSLNAFSMLENTHTLDADYIYRDFKELIVELGYFEKEELTDETPRLLQWLIPDIGSGGYPNRTIDKNEHEFGTMIHSKGDIKANSKNALRAIIEAAPEKTDSPEGAGSEEENTSVGLKMNQDINIIGQLASINMTPITNLENIGAISDIPDADYTFEASGSTEKATKTGDLEYNGVAYEIWKQTESTCTLYSFAFIAQAYTGESPDNYLKSSDGSYINYSAEGQGGNTYWAEGAGVNWSMFESVGIEGNYYFPGEADIGTKVSDALKEGKPVYFYGDLNASAGYHAVVLLGAGDGGKVVFYDPGPGSVSTFGTSSSFSSNLNSLLSTHFKHRIFIPNEVPTGVEKQAEGNPYEGYEGNEAVVSPVTGILLDYGTYETEKDSVTGEEYRVNTDLKYGTGLISATNSEGENSEAQETTPSEQSTENSSEEFQGETQIDKVGYAKILVLDKENYKKLESAILSKTQWDESLLYDSGNYFEIENLTEEQVNNEENPWSDVDKTLYGYKEFARLYEEYGIAGNVVYIDGFKCEMPDEEFDIENAIDTESPSGEEIKIEDFETAVTASSFDGEGNLSEDTETLESLYEADAEYKLASKKATEKLNTETMIKDEAVSSLYVNGLRVIKEGTVIGRTITDRELIVDYRGKNYGDYRITGENSQSSTSETETQENEDKVIGNYIRIIMSDVNKDVVENVEDYLKLDDGGDSGSGDAQPYKAQEGDDIILANMMHHEGCTLGFQGMGYSEEEADKINMVTGYVLLNRAIVNYGNHGTTIVDQLLAPGQYATAYVANNQTIECMECYENAQLCLKYDCNYVKNPDGKEMTHDVLGQSGWDQCPDNSVLGKNCFWWVDDNFNGIPEEYYEGCSHFDEFFCYNPQYEGM